MTASGSKYSKKVSLLSQQGSNIKVKIKSNGKKKPKSHLVKNING